MDSEKTSFDRLVIQRAMSDTARFLGYRTRDLILGGIALILGAICAYFFVGKVDTSKEIALMVAFTFAPSGFILFAVFLWHLWLAPTALTYEAVQSTISLQADAEPAKALPREQSVNWAVWKQRGSYSLKEFAAILAKSDPASAKTTTEKTSFLRLLQEDAVARKLSVQRDRLAEGYYQPDLYPDYFDVQKATAIQWAESKGFDMAHIK